MYFSSLIIYGINIRYQTNILINTNKDEDLYEFHPATKKQTIYG